MLLPKKKDAYVAAFKIKIMIIKIKKILIKFKMIKKRKNFNKLMQKQISLNIN